MKLKRNSNLAAAILTIISLLLIAVTISCRSRRANEPVVRRSELRGRVESLDFNRKRVTVAHEEIKGYMEAMTMSFAVKDENVLRELKSGDQVQATLVYDSSTNLSWLEDIKV
ncbi:MAG: copper-binding protein, partial [Acidobacteria bacterium]|nr:copper-binding protein [Acidobacteriota bacterium]